MPKLQIPTGYEELQRKAAAKRKIAAALLARGMTGDNQMTSWAQPLAQMAQAFAGKRLDKKADKLDAEYTTQMREAYTSGLDRLHAAKAGGMSNEEIVKTFSAEPLLQDAIKPYQDAMAAALKERENIVDIGGSQGYGRVGDWMGKPKPNDPNSAVVYDDKGNWMVNPVRRQAALEAQGYSPGGAGFPSVGAMPDPAMAPPPGGPAPGGDGLDLSLLNQEERGILQNELERRAGGGQSQFNPDPNTPMGNPLTALPAPAGVVNGKPYWIINGVPYDNPEGK